MSAGLLLKSADRSSALADAPTAVISLLVLGLLCVRAAYLSPAPLLSTRRHAAAAPRGGLLHLAEAETVVSPFADGEGDAAAAGDGTLELTMENVDLVLDEMRPYLLADGGNVAVRSVDGGVIELELQGACGSCPSSSMTMKMGLERGLREKFADIVDVVQVAPDGPVVRCPPRAPHPTPRAPAHPALNAPPRVPQLDEAGIEEVLEQIRPFLAMVPALRPRTSPRAGRARLWLTPPTPGALWQAGGEVELISLEPDGMQPTACLKISGSGATINSVRVEIAQRLKRNFPTLANVTWD